MAVKPTLYFAHANGFPGGSYRTFLAPLAEYYDVRVLDRAGHDPAWPVDANWHSLSLQLEAELEACPRPLIGVGHSLGAVLMFMVASRRPEWFRSLVMLDPPLINGWQGALFNLARLFGQVDRVSPAGLSLGRRDYWPDLDSAREYFGRRGFFASLDPRCLQDYMQAGLEPVPDEHGASGSRESAQGWRLRFRPEVEVAIFRTTPGNIGRYPPIKVPSLMISGSDSPAMFRIAASRHVRRHNMLWWDAPGEHMFPLQNPEGTARLLIRGLQALEKDALEKGEDRASA